MMASLGQTTNLKRKRTEEPSTIKHEQHSFGDACQLEVPNLFKRDAVPLYKKALALFPASTTLENSRYPTPEVSSLESFYSHAQPAVSDQRLENYSTPRIAATLSPFQLQNVEWMISREGHKANANGDIEPDLSIYTSLPLLYTGAHETEQTGTYIDVITTKTTTDRATVSDLIQLSYSGGILSDEMGLGKTVRYVVVGTCRRLGSNTDT